MPERDRSKVTLVLTEADARWLVNDALYNSVAGHTDQGIRVRREIYHALAECECGEEGR